MDLVATLGGAGAGRSGDTWRVGRPLSAAFDASLTEKEVVRQFRQEPIPSAQGTPIAASGAYCYRGRFISSPYDIRTERDSKGAYHVMLNGISVEKIAPRPARGTFPVPNLPSNGQFKNQEDLRNYICHRLYPEQLAQGVSQELACKAVIDFLGTQKIVTALVPDATNPENIQFQIVNAPFYAQPTCPFPDNYDFKTGKLIGMSEGPPLTEEQSADNSAARLESRLKSGETIIVGTAGVEVSLQPASARQLGELARQAAKLSVLQAECVLTELIGDRSVARELAANMTPAFIASPEKVSK
ncbi:MAG: hypothetical protein WC655_14290 [Candidatus Hydrogenedentales bacterium]